MTIEMWEIGKTYRYEGEKTADDISGLWFLQMLDGVPRRCVAVDPQNEPGNDGVAFEGVLDPDDRDGILSYQYSKADFVEVMDAKATKTRPNFRRALCEKKKFWAEVTPETSSILQAIAFDEGVIWASGLTIISFTDKPILMFAEDSGREYGIYLAENYAEIAGLDNGCKYLPGSDEFVARLASSRGADDTDGKDGGAATDADHGMERVFKESEEAMRQMMPPRFAAPPSEFKIVRLLGDLVPVAAAYKEIGVTPEWILNWVGVRLDNGHIKAE